MQASKWMTIPALLDHSELAALLDALGPVYLYLTGVVVSKGAAELSKEQFLAHYRRYLDDLANETLPAVLITTANEAIERKELPGDREMVRPVLPVVQLSAHSFAYSPLDQKYRSNVPGVSWGYTFAYPQLFENPETRAVEKVDERFPNTKLFRNIQRWMRRQTLPTPFVAEGKRTNTPIRIGKGAIEWVNSHPQLAKMALSVSK